MLLSSPVRTGARFHLCTEAGQPEQYRDKGVSEITDEQSRAQEVTRSPERLMDQCAGPPSTQCVPQAVRHTRPKLAAALNDFWIE